MKRILVLIVITTCAIVGNAQNENVDPNVRLDFSVAGSRSEFHLGETIPLQLAFSSTVKDRYQLNMAQYDRSGRMNYETFVLTPAGGAVDPLPTYSDFMMGGLTSFQFLTSQPWELKLNLNEWLRFTKPGEYRLTIFSSRVGVPNSSSRTGAPLRARSNEIRLRIVSATALWQQEVFKKAVVALNAVRPSDPQNRQSFDAAKRDAIETLRFLDTADA